ncbi:DUF7373 family lipoprotein [Nocardia acidivorans]|uniref:DUF7373 family lipoprotein n=1 Tax=Nocardia acidivorans TaxID=404580 RepID=UPI0012F80F98|nr:hypothetical protein [Nocardia acidivorans]
MVALIAAIASTSVACGNGSQTTDHSSALDIGPYSTQRPDSGFDDQPSETRGMLVESLRLGERAVFGSDVAPEFSAGHGGTVLATDSGFRNADGVSAPAMQPFRPLAAFNASAADTPYIGEYHKHYELSISLVAFPDDQSAADAAVALEHSDFGANSSNVPVSLSSYPAALSHWRPGTPNLGSWMAFKSVVIAVYVESLQADLDQLTGFVSKAYQQQIPKLDGYTPTAPDQLAMLKMDQDRLLTRLVKTDDTVPDQQRFAVYSPRGFAGQATDPAAVARDFESQGVKAIAVSDNKYLYKLSDAAAARDYLTHLANDPTVSKYVPMSGVPAMADIACFKATQPNSTTILARRFRCLIPHEGFVAEVFSDQETDVRQLAAAEYQLLKDAG